MACDLCSIFTAVGLICFLVGLGRILLLSISGFVTFVLAAHLPLAVQWRKYGKWAVVTGASDGMGKEFALQLAANGLNIVLVSRTLQKLNSVSSEIETKFGVKTKCVQFDFSKGSLEDLGRLRNSLNELEIGVLVNNVGIFFDYPDLLHQTPGGNTAIMNVLNVDVVTLTTMIQSLLPAMVSRKKGIVINMASSLGLEPTGTYAVYSAAKSYCIFLTEALRLEYGNKGIVFQTVIPGIVSTNMAKNYRDAPMQTTADIFVKAVLSQVGLRSVTNGYWKHALLATVFSYTPKLLASSKIFEDSAHRKQLFLAAQKAN